MSINDRIRKLRKALDLTQAEFGQRIRLKGNSVALIEGGRNTSEQTIYSICTAFHVNETWLRTGEGEMFVPEPEDDLATLVKRYQLPSETYVLLREFVALSEKERQTVIQYIRNVAAAFAKEGYLPSVSSVSSPSPPAPDGQLPPEAYPADEAEALELARQIIRDKRRAEESSVWPGGRGGTA